MKSTLALTIVAHFLLSQAGTRADSFFVSNFGINTITRYDKDGNDSLFTDSFINGPTGITLD
ncbi:MAG: hypothetical protein M3480_06865, partial [Verrucomicrobiota bacterium]|nr:hypothetical protein [Verrucomicrobiota bacterium]